MEQEDVEVLYLRGNHDDVLERFLPFALGRLHIAKDMFTGRRTAAVTCACTATG